MKKLTRALTNLSNFLIAFGPFGLFVVAILDSTFVPLPSSVDALMMILSTARPRWMLLYATIATSGSALGCLILYLISRRAGGKALKRFSEAKQRRVKELIDRYDLVAVLVATLMPPPFPFKLFVITAGVFRFSLPRFMIAIIAGRGIRFLLVGYFAIRYGEQAKTLLAKQYPWIGLGLAVSVILIFVIRSITKPRQDRSVEEPVENP
jgi:membrane protein YqaA with SNARE-associated domain